jgi:hypothetical protein
MPQYAYEDGKGNRISRYHKMSDAPPLGHKIRVSGVRYTRILGNPVTRIRPTRHFVSHSLPRWHPNAPRYDGKGKPCFDSQREVSEFVSKCEGDYEEE